MILISVSGKANTGKNTLSKLLAEEIKSRLYDWKGNVFIAFADPIKEIVRIMFPNLPKKYLFGSSEFRNKVIPGAFKNGSPLTIRMALTDIGTDFKNYNYNLWLDVFNKKLAKSYKKSSVIVTDVRFKNEFDYLKQLGFYQIRIYRDEVVKSNHISETNQDTIKDSEFNYVVNNSGTLEDLKAQVVKIVDELVL